MDLRQLEYFVRVAELGSFTRASIALNVAQPALSRQIRLLEVELRQNLLTRNGRGAKPTEAGKLLLEHGRGILHQVDLARDEVVSARGSLSGRVAVGLPPSLSRHVTVPLTRALRQELPQARLTLTEGFSVLIYEALRVGNLDMAVMYNAPSSPEVETVTLHQEGLALVSARSRATGPITLARVAALPLVLPSQPNAFRRLIEEEMSKIGARPQIALEVDGLNAILNLVKDGVGHAVLPSYTLSKFEKPEQYVVRRIHSPPIQCTLSLVWSARRPVTETHRRALEIIRQVVHQLIQPARLR